MQRFDTKPPERLEDTGRQHAALFHRLDIFVRKTLLPVILTGPRGKVDGMGFGQAGEAFSRLSTGVSSTCI
jgi:hypothetical protein